MNIRLANLEDLKYIDSLSKKESKSIGFIPKARYEAAIVGRRLKEKEKPTCNDKLLICYENDEPVGFLIASNGKDVATKVAKVHQICIQEDARLIERGKALLNYWIDFCSKIGIFDYSCGCAEDLDSNLFWKAMGWEHIDTRMGIFYGTSKQSSKRIVNIYRYETDTLFPSLEGYIPQKES